MAFNSKPTSGDADDDRSTSEIVATEVSRSHVLTIDGYSCTTRVRRNEYITSSSFTAAGHRWSIRLLDKDGKPTTHSYSTGSDWTLTGNNGNRLGIKKFVKRKSLEQLGYIRDDRIRIRCDITVLKLLVRRDVDVTSDPNFVDDVPPSNILQHLGNLLSSGDGTDVMFEVDGETIHAHRSILAARSPVFKAELFSPMMEGTTTCVRVQDMDPWVFKAMLHFVYNDVWLEIDEGETMVMAQHLLDAADRYCLERLKLICEEKLCSYIDTNSVGTMLALAEKHGCHGLQKACLSFLMSSENLKAAIVCGGLQHVLSSCPSVVKELLMKSCS